MAKQDVIDASMLLRAYMHGVFPMARSRSGNIDWYCPDPRAVLPLDRFRVPRSLARRVRQGRFTVTADTAFERVMRQCALPRRYTNETWINESMIQAYTSLNGAGYAHSIEAWSDNTPGRSPELVGGLYGVAIGGAFFGESMFSCATDASKVCLVHLVNHMRAGGYSLLDVQLTSSHMRQFGTIEIDRDRFMTQLDVAMRRPVTWGKFAPKTPPPERQPAERSAP